jgi:hypothetical protein
MDVQNPTLNRRTFFCDTKNGVTRVRGSKLTPEIMVPIGLKLQVSPTSSQEAQAYMMAVRTVTIQPSIIQHEMLFLFV